MTATPDAWKEFCKISILKEGASQSEFQFDALTEDITAMDFGEKDTEGIVNLKGGRITRDVPMTDESVTLKVYPVDVNLGANGVAQWFHPQGLNTGDDDTTQPIIVKNTKERVKHRVVFLWSTRLPSTAAGLPGLGEPALRMQIVNANVTRYVPSNDGKVLSAEMTLKWSPFQKDGSENKREESTDGSVLLPDASSTATTFGP